MISGGIAFFPAGANFFTHRHIRTFQRIAIAFYKDIVPFDFDMVGKE